MPSTLGVVHSATPDEAPKEPKPEVSAYYTSRAVPWDPQMKYERELVLETSSFMRWIHATCPVVTDMKAIPYAKKNSPEVIKVGPRWVFYLRNVPTYHWTTPSLYIFALGKPRWEKLTLPTFRSGDETGTVTFVEDVSIPVLADSEDRFKPWMSLTPMEVFSQRPGIRKAKGRVLVGGLGMGWLAQQACHKKGVKSVTVVEKDPDVAKFFGDMLREHSPKVTLEIIVADVYEYIQNRENQFDSILMDIWLDHADARFDKRFTELKARHQRVWGWGDYAWRD